MRDIYFINKPNKARETIGTYNSKMEMFFGSDIYVVLIIILCRFHMNKYFLFHKVIFQFPQPTPEDIDYPTW